MAFELKVNQGSLFVVRQKRGDNFPDWEGEINIGGKVMRLAGWNKETKAGKPWLSLKLSEAREKPASPPPTQQAAQSFPDDPNDPIPF